MPYYPSEAIISIADGSRVNAIGNTDDVTIHVHGTVSKLKMTILPIRHIDVLLGLDWFRQTKAIVDPTNKILRFPMKEVCLADFNNEETLEQIPQMQPECFIVSEEAMEIDEIENDNEWDLVRITDSENEKRGLKRKLTDIDEYDDDLSEESRNEFKKIMRDTEDIFADDIESLGCCYIKKHKIVTTTEEPIYIPPYRIPQKER